MATPGVLPAVLMRFLYFWLRVATVVAPRVPFRVAYAIGGLAGNIAYIAWWGGRRTTRENMSIVLGLPEDHPAVARTARRSLVNYMRYIVDLSRLAQETPQSIERRIIFDEWDLIDDAFSRGKGVIFVLMHFGMWDLGGAIIAQRGHIMNVVAETLEHPQMNEIVQGTRAFRGMRVIPMEKAASKIVRALHANEAVGILIDRPVPGAGVPATFFGARTEVPAGVGRIALRTDAALMVVALARASGNRVTGIVEPIEVTHTDDATADLRAVTQRVMSAHERIIRRYPDQWFMFRRMWAPLPALSADAGIEADTAPVEA